MMPRLLAIGLSQPALDVVSAVAAAHALPLDIKSHDMATSAVEEADDVQAIVLPGVPDPVRIVRRCHAAAPEASVVIVGSEAQCRAVRSALRFSPSIGREVHCLALEDADIVERVGAAIGRGRRRAATLQTIGALNRRLSEPAPPSRTSAVLLGRVLDLAPIGVVILDAQASIRELNPRAVTLLGEDELALAGQPLWAHFPAADQERLRAVVAAFDGQSAAPRQSFGLGARRLAITGAPLTPAAGGPGYLVLIEDTTDREALVAELEAANRRKDEFLAMLGHELRNPLAPIQTAVELLKLRNVPAIERERAIIERQVTHLVQLVDDLLDISRITRGRIDLRRKQVEIASVVTEAVEITRTLIQQRRHTLLVDVPAAGLLVDVDPARITQVLTNLLTNAARYAEPGGTIEITGMRRDAEVVIAVRDTGRGITPELLPRVFEMFVQSDQPIDRAAGGLGLGLAIVSSLVKLHGGSVGATSEVGVGSVFEVRLPAAGAAPVDASAGSDLAVAAVPAKRRALIVDDNEDAAQMLAMVLEQLGYTTHIVHDGLAAIDQAPGVAPDFVLLDIGLPGIDGFEVARRFAATPGLASVPLLALTGYGQPEDRARTAAVGFREHLVKPVSIANLQAALTRVLG